MTTKYGTTGVVLLKAEPINITLLVIDIFANYDDVGTFILNNSKYNLHARSLF